MNESSTYEFVVSERPEGKRKAVVILARTGLLAFIAAFVIAALCTFPALAVLPLGLLGLVLYFWKIFNRECEYSMTSGIMTFSYIYGGGVSRRKVLDLFIKDMREIAPVTDGTMEHLNALGVEKDYRFVSSSSADDMYYAVFDQDGKLSVIYFEATAKTISILYYYNHATVRTTVSR